MSEANFEFSRFFYTKPVSTVSQLSILKSKQKKDREIQKS